MAEIIIHDNYPLGCEDVQIKADLKKLTSEILQSHGNINTVMRLAPLVTIGIEELQSRRMSMLHKEIEDLRAITQQATQASDRVSSRSLVIANRSFWVSVMATAVAFVSVFAQLFSATDSSKSEKVSSFC